jgi:hypothetical protein
MEDESIRELINSVGSSPWDDYRQHPGQVALGKWVDVQNFYHGVVIKNEILLLQYLKAPIVSKKIRKQIFKSIGESNYGIEATRRLYNYISSISSLADHTRNLLKDYKTSSFETEYLSRLSRVTELNEFDFLKDLRNYAAHYKIPPIGYIIGTTNILGRNEAFLPVIYTGDLFDYDNWSKGSKQYMKDNFTEIELIKLVDIYAQAINELYVWMFDQFISIHGKDVNDSEKIKQGIIEGQIK